MKRNDKIIHYEGLK
ncbi:hypothetical protein [Escherichia coli]